MDDVRATCFLSAVTGEFGNDRDYLRSILTRWNVEVKIQEDFINSGTDTLEKLWRYIEQADVVVQIAGATSGALPAEESVESLFCRFPDLLSKLPVLMGFRADGVKLSYTQWEAFFALYHNRHLALFSPARRNLKSSGPRDATQSFYLDCLKTLDLYPSPFRNRDDLAVQVLCSPVFDFIVRRSVERIIRRRSDTPQSHRQNSIRALRQPLQSLGRRLAVAESELVGMMNSIPDARVEGYEDRYLVEDLVAIPRLFRGPLDEALESQNILPPKLVREVREVVVALEVMAAEFQTKATWDYVFNRQNSENRHWVGLMNREHVESACARLMFARTMVAQAARTVERNLPERHKLNPDWPFIDPQEEFAENMLSRALRHLRWKTSPRKKREPDLPQ